MKSYFLFVAFGLAIQDDGRARSTLAAAKSIEIEPGMGKGYKL